MSSHAHSTPNHEPTLLLSQAETLSILDTRLQQLASFQLHTKSLSSSFRPPTMAQASPSTQTTKGVRFDARDPNVPDYRTDLHEKATNTFKYSIIDTAVRRKGKEPGNRHKA